MWSVTCDRMDILIESFGYEMENCGNLGKSLCNVRRKVTNTNAAFANTLDVVDGYFNPGNSDPRLRNGGNGPSSSQLQLYFS